MRATTHEAAAGGFIFRWFGSVEKFVTGLTCAWVVVLPWLIGGRPWWAPVVGAVLGALALGVAASRAENRRALWRFPVFWLGLAFLLLQLCQALNPWVVAVQTEPGVFYWQLSTLKHIDWLPSGIRADYFEMNTWRTLVYWLAPGFFVCAWWIAVRRRRAWTILTWAVFVNGFIMTVVVIIQSRYPSNTPMWFYPDPSLDGGRILTAAFTYRNAAAIYLYLSMATGFALACRVHARARIEGRDSGFTWVLLLGCLLTLASFFLMGSRAAVVIGAFLFLAGLLALFITSLYTGGPSPGLWAGGAVLALGLAALVIFAFTGRNSWTLDRWRYLSSHPQEDTRQILRQQTLRMVKDHPWLGFGGGSYRYISPDYFRSANIWGSNAYYGGLKYKANYAHSDWLQLTMEFGLVGSGLLVAILLYLYGYALALARWLGPPGGMILLAGAVMLAHATMDFPAYNPAVLLLFCMLLVATVKNAQIEARHDAERT